MARFNSLVEWEEWKKNLLLTVTNIVAACDQLDCAGYATDDFRIGLDDVEEWIADERPADPETPEGEDFAEPEGLDEEGDEDE